MTLPISGYALSCLPAHAVRSNQANLMLGELARDHAIVMIDSDALVAELGAKQVSDRFYASGGLMDTQRDEVRRVSCELRISGF